ncbi:3-carboxy-cis,cis-muconate cycloisomerase [Bradyrhizobium sp. NFR13]|jgi:3-carboxy-cis,cis-muconate cycloisomerase|uniref:class-II fumarase/aspartase family protein n=1 Tax=Bradyrhizobium sp. NFR13 TaxID=1566285 RepID=UPI0008E1D081|nr:adenylosuccinate lyase family protein [Bradyrhizobium sp. NFR13]SFL58014.1 3-carboxy-cis,cis-muconate cycloisomerase [Bradyrhizobium sp. NFR13]
MGSTVFDSVLFRDMFGTAEMRAVFADEALVGRYIEAEVALARAQARLGVVPKEAAQAIEAAAKSIRIDFDKLRAETEIVGYPILPLVHQLSEAAGEAGRYVHWGATTQDIMDTANVLQIRAALQIVARDLREVRDILATMAKKYRDTPMAGRTHLQQALPVTFGYKAAVWLSSIDRHIERVDQALPRILLGEFSGAAGTLASVGEGGLEMQRLFCEELGLHQPAITWHVARDGIAEAVTLLGLITGTLGKIATDVMLLSSSEFGEVSEPFVPGRGASSTMPQKRNAISSELMLAAAKAVRQHVATMLDGMIHDLERATGPWHLEWVSLPESFLLTASSLANAKFMLAGLVVHEKRMLENLDLTRGLIVAEAVMMAAAPKLGRQHAHDVVYDACRKAIEGGGQLADILAEVPEITEALGGKEAIRRHCDPANYLGLCGPMVDRVLSMSGR